MKKTIKRIIFNLNYAFLLKNIILMESNPDFEDNTRAVYDELIRRGVNKKIKIVWFCYGNKHFDVPKNVKCIYPDKNRADRIKKIFYNYFAKYIIDCNRFIDKKNKNQFRLHLTHGTPLKRASSYGAGVGHVDYLLSLSKYFNVYNSEIFCLPEKKIINLGFPRNDWLLQKKEQSIRYRSSLQCKKLVVWFPTYRNHKAEINTDKKSFFKYGVPNIHNIEELTDLDNYLANRNIVMLIKTHPVEDTSHIESIKLKNIKLLAPDELSSQNMNIYDLLSVSDALITDYSSAYYDYLLLDKPICLAIEDVDEYVKTKGIIFSKYEGNIVGEYAYGYKDLKKFIKNIAQDKDICKTNRDDAKNRFHMYLDDKSSERTVDFFLNKIGYRL